MIITVDGPSAAGKGTLARGLAAALGFAHLDTGLLYRAVAFKALATGATETRDLEAIAEALVPDDLRREGLRGEEISQAASQVAALPEVRAALLAFQRRFADRPPGGEAGVVLDGRDIGTVVCPQADVKFFITASSAARARRRHKELIERGDRRIHARVLEEMVLRDARDSGRTAAPLRPDKDAIVLDTTEMDADAVLETAIQMVASRRLAGSA
jgi:cytidylate kinase